MMSKCELMVNCDKPYWVMVQDTAGVFRFACREHAAQVCADRLTLETASDWELSW